MSLLQDVEVGDVVLVDSCCPFRIPSCYEARVVKIAGNVAVKVRPISGWRRWERWVQWYQVDGVVVKAELDRLERLFR